MRNCDCGSASFKLRNCDCGLKKKLRVPTSAIKLDKTDSRDTVSRNVPGIGLKGALLRKKTVNVYSRRGVSWLLSNSKFPSYNAVSFEYLRVYLILISKSTYVELEPLVSAWKMTQKGTASRDFLGSQLIDLRGDRAFDVFFFFIDALPILSTNKAVPSRWKQNPLRGVQFIWHFFFLFSAYSYLLPKYSIFY